MHSCRFTRKTLSASRSFGLAFVVLAGSHFVSPASAVVLFSTPVRNTTAPAGNLLDSGWQFQGTWRQFNGTPISRKFFITAGHVGGEVGERFRIGGRRFTTTAYWDDPNSDLRLYSVDKRFSAWAPLNTSTREAGKHAMIFGRGTTRGADVIVNAQLKGWEWGTQDGVQSWGLNVVEGAIEGEPGEGQLLEFEFNSSNNGAIAQEGTLSNGDSAGGVFIYDRKDKRWELAGINYSVDGPFQLSPGGPNVQAALYDLGGVTYGGQAITDELADVPSRFYSSRISTSLSWINAVLSGQLAPTSPAASSRPASVGVPEPGSALVAVGAPALLLRRRRG